MRYVLTAHYRQLHTLLRRTTQVERTYYELDSLVERHQLPERVVEALFEAVSGRRVRNATYRALAASQSAIPVHEGTISRDLKTLVQLQLLEAHGERRGRFYTMGPGLRGIAASVRESRPKRDDTDPFALTALGAGQHTLFE